MEVSREDKKGHIIKENDLSQALDDARAFLYGKKPFDTAVYVGILALIPLSFFFSASLLIVPITHGIGGWILHNDKGWKFFQPGLGGSRFIALNAVGWFLFAVALLIQIINMWRRDMFLSFSGFSSGLMSISFIASSLLAFQTKASHSVEIGDTKELKNSKEHFKDLMENSILRHNGETPSGLFWVLIGLQLWLCVTGGWFLFLLAFAKNNFPILQLLAAFLSTACFTCTTPVSHAIGGKWKNYGKSFVTFQPFRGGNNFIALQAFGWSSYGACQVSALYAFARIWENSEQRSFFLILTAICGVVAEFSIVFSLFVFEEYDIQEKKRFGVMFQASSIDVVVGFANWAFCPSHDWKTKTRRTILKTESDWKAGETKFQECLKTSRANLATGEQYLIVGCGFVGKRIVKRLLERGEERIRVFDLNPVNSFAGDDRIEYVVGNVTNFKDIYRACKGVDTVYATFALIRYMDRLKHQVAVSYLVNVMGTEVLFEAIFECAEIGNRSKDNPMKVIITSSSHATTDELSEPRRNRTEDAPYVTEQTAHNHYGWTKALADKFALSVGSSKEFVRTTVVRPCSGVFGGNDRTSLQKCLDLGIAPGIGSFCEMDWVYVENVVLGHLLAERALVKEINGEIKTGTVNGQAFNISNNDPTTWIDFWHLVKDTIRLTSVDIEIKYCFVPMSLIWATAYFSEGIQRIFRGRIKLGQDLDSLTPAMLQTATMSYTYKSEKANKVLGYFPAYSLDEGVQKGVIEYVQSSRN